MAFAVHQQVAYIMKPGSHQYHRLVSIFQAIVGGDLICRCNHLPGMNQIMINKCGFRMLFVFRRYETTGCFNNRTCLHV
jgi:hypothetical protein